MNGQTNSKIPILFLLLCWLVFLLSLANSAPLLPARVATHFGMGGRPNGWMSRRGYLQFLAIAGCVLTLYFIGICYAARFLPNSTIHIPHRDYWLAPQRREAALGRLLRQSFWLAALVVVFLTALHWVTVQANRQTPIRLPASSFWATVAGFFAGMAVWIISLRRIFKVPPDAGR